MSFRNKIILILLIGFVVFISGCLSSLNVSEDLEYCEKVEKAAREDGKNCKCFGSRKLPKNLKNQSEKLTPKCLCRCFMKGKWYNFSIVQSGEEQRKIIR